jgi:hypothetical protein
MRKEPFVKEPTSGIGFGRAVLFHFTGEQDFLKKNSFFLNPKQENKRIFL